MLYDKAEWHYAGSYPNTLPPENGATHIGMFISWVINSDLVGDLHNEDSQESLKAVKQRRMTGTQFLLQECDERFTNEDLNDEGNNFAAAYYQSLYFNDYHKALASGLPSSYHVIDSWDNYDAIARIITDRYQQWKEGRLPKPKPWWKFW